MAEETEFPYRQPKPNRAKRLAKEALALAREERFQEALPLLERAIRLDQLNALDQYCGLRAEICEALGDRKPTLAIKFYGHAIQCKRSGRYRDAIVAYQEAHCLDPVFLWPMNNLAWLLATSKEPAVRDGKEALKFAQVLCMQSRLNCWAFLGTLAAACAESGEFSKAVGWQTSALLLAPVEHQMDALIVLRHFQAGRAYIDEGLPVAAGGEDATPSPVEEV
jgi:tetratricopeptide (TPR) repeat protein